MHSSDFCKKNIISNFQLWIRASGNCNKSLKLDVPDILWRKNAIGHFFSFSHHLCYVGGNHLHSLYELLFSFLNYLLRSLTPSWLFFHLFGTCRLASQIPRGSRYLYLDSTTYCLHPIIVPLNLENKSIMHVCKNRKKTNLLFSPPQIQ